mgnify:CR=1 FL=1
MTNEFLNKKILITGGSKGLGKAAAIAFEKKGANLAIVARDKKKIDDFKTEEATGIIKSKENLKTILEKHYHLIISQYIMVINVILIRNFLCFNLNKNSIFTFSELNFSFSFSDIFFMFSLTRSFHIFIYGYNCLKFILNISL